MHNNPYFNVFLDHVINLYKMIETCLKDDNMHIFVMINALICINNYVITCINSMLSWDYLCLYFFAGDMACCEAFDLWI